MYTQGYYANKGSSYLQIAFNGQDEFRLKNTTSYNSGIYTRTPQGKYSLHQSFGSSTLKEIYTEDALASAYTLKSYYFESVVLVNNGTKGFSIEALPSQSQFSSINGFLVNDLNEDGFEDVVLAGNLFVSEIETPRNDAGYGLVLINNTHGEFSTLDTHQSGLFIPYDVKR
jgi:hypothetical protein